MINIVEKALKEPHLHNCNIIKIRNLYNLSARESQYVLKCIEHSLLIDKELLKRSQ